MTASKLILSMMFLPLAALPGEAQRVQPVAARAADASMMLLVPDRGPMAARDTEPAAHPTISSDGALVGGVLGALIGGVAGMYIGAAIRDGCHGDFCALEGAVLGIGIAEPLGLAVGAHLGSGSTRHERILLTAATSAGILVGGTLLGVAAGQVAGPVALVMLPLIPALQVAAAVAIERH